MTDGLIGGTLRRLRRERLRGRGGELAWFEGVLGDDAVLPCVVWVWGIGGIGKTAFVEVALDKLSPDHRNIIWVNCEHTPPTPRSLDEIGGGARLGSWDRPDVLVLDAAEHWRELMPWLLRDWLADQHPGLALVITSRERCPLRLRTDTALSALLHEHELGPLDAVAARERLGDLAVDAALHDAFVERAHGHPLALGLLADLSDGGHDLASLEDLPELVECFAAGVPDAAHRQALDALALLPGLGRPDLEALGNDEATAREIERWLQARSFVRRSEGQLRLHELVRDVLAAALAHEEPGRLAALVRVLVEHRLDGLPAATLEGKERIYRDCIYTARLLPRVRELGSAAPTGAWGVEPLRDPAWVETVARQVRHHECPGAEESFRWWVLRQPEGLRLLRGADGEIVGVLFLLRLDREHMREAPPDPLVDAVWRLRKWEQPGPPVEELGFFRWFFTRDAYQDFNPLLTRLIMYGPFLSLHPDFADLERLVYATTPVEAWRPLAPVFNLHWAKGCDVPLKGRAWGLFAIDQYRTVGQGRPGETPLDTVIRQHMLAMLPQPDELAAAPSAVVTELDVDGLREALAVWKRPPELAASALGRALGPKGGAAAAAVLEQALATLAGSGGYDDDAEVLRVSYLDEPGNQRAAAARLQLPFGTYRYRLRRAWHHLLPFVNAELAQIRAGRPPPT